MEEMLIEHVRGNPILYDRTNRGYRNQQSRMEAWEQIGENLGIPGNDCKENWNKLRNAYIQAKNRRATKSGEAAKHIIKWKFEEEMSFLTPTLVRRKTQGNTGLSVHDEDDDVNDGCPLEEIDPLVIDNPTASLSDSSRTCAEPQIFSSIMKASSPTFAQPSANPVRSCARKRGLTSSVQEMVSIMKDNQFLRTQQLLQSAPALPQNNIDDECELFFLSMAKNVKKLRPDEQIRVKMEVSNIVLGAALQAARANLAQEDPHNIKCVTNLFP